VGVKGLRAEERLGRSLDFCKANPESQSSHDFRSSGPLATDRSIVQRFCKVYRGE
jgi:hypothetical protein